MAGRQAREALQAPSSGSWRAPTRPESAKSGSSAPSTPSAAQPPRRSAYGMDSMPAGRGQQGRGSGTKKQVGGWVLLVGASYACRCGVLRLAGHVLWRRRRWRPPLLLSWVLTVDGAPRAIAQLPQHLC